jgi:hypothetical protein
MWSVDMADDTKRHLYADGALDMDPLDFNEGETLDFTVSDWSVGGSPTGTQKFSGDIADLQFWIGVYVDLSQASNREIFINGGQPVDPAVAELALGEPKIQLVGQATAGWETNTGSGGGFTENGALTDGTEPVEL